MTKEEYLNKLKNNLGALTSDEMNEALQYYSDYFAEANDDQKVIEELGSPEELAKTIEEKFANAPMNTQKNSESSQRESCDSKESGYSNGNKEYRFNDEILYFEFESEDVQKLAINIGAAEVVMITGVKYSIETRGFASENLNCFLSSDGTLSINNLKKLNFNFWGHNRSSRIVPRLLITVPENAKLDSLKVVIGAGDFRTKGCSFYCKNVSMEVGAGNLVFGRIMSCKAKLRCGMGNLEVSGEMKGNSLIDCGMGSVKLDLSGNPEEYSYDAKVGLGDFKFNSQKRSGVCQFYSSEKKENHFSVNCGMGSVNVKMK